jgi:hypothetical protein
MCTQTRTYVHCTSCGTSENVPTIGPVVDCGLAKREPFKSRNADEFCPGTQVVDEESDELCHNCKLLAKHAADAADAAADSAEEEGEEDDDDMEEVEIPEQ